MSAAAKIMAAATIRSCRALLAAGLLAGIGTASISAAAPVAGTSSVPSSVLAALGPSPRRLLFRDVILATTGHGVLPFDTNNPAHSGLRRQILQAAAEAGREIRRQKGLPAVRANEAGNSLEPFVRAALNRVQVVARVPVTVDGRAQASGYPDLEITAPIPCYLELKTYSAATANTTQRSFYYSPSPSPKVTCDAIHLLLAYELEATEREGQTTFVPTHWRLIDLHDLEVDLKFEFNQSNRRLYGRPQAVLGEGALPPDSTPSR